MQLGQQRVHHSWETASAPFRGDDSALYLTHVHAKHILHYGHKMDN